MDPVQTILVRGTREFYRPKTPSAKHRRRELKQTYILYPVSCSSHNLGTNIRTKLKTDGRTKSHLEVCTLSKKKVSVACEDDSIRKISKIS